MISTGTVLKAATESSNGLEFAGRTLSVASGAKFTVTGGMGQDGVMVQISMMTFSKMLKMIL